MVPTQRYVGSPGFVTVTKVGRKWAELSARGYRIDKTTLIIDGAGYTSPGRCYLTKDEHTAEENMRQAWRKLRDFIDRKYSPPHGITVESVEAALHMLGYSEPAKER